MSYDDRDKCYNEAIEVKKLLAEGKLPPLKPRQFDPHTTAEDGLLITHFK